MVFLTEWLEIFFLFVSSSLAAAKASLRNLPISFFPRGLSRYHTLSFGFRWWFMACRLLLLACAFGSNALWWPPSCPVLLPLSDFKVHKVFRIRFRITGQSYISPAQLTAFISSPPAKMERKKPLQSPYFGSWTPNWPFSNSASSSASVSSLAAFGQFPFPCRTRSFRLAASTSLDLENSLSLRMLTRLPFSCKRRWKLRWKPLKVPALTQCHFVYGDEKLGKKEGLAHWQVCLQLL